MVDPWSIIKKMPRTVVDGQDLDERLPEVSDVVLPAEHECADVSPGDEVWMQDGCLSVVHVQASLTARGMSESINQSINQNFIFKRKSILHSNNIE